MTVPILKNIIKGRTVFVGIGNILKGDDGVGPFFIECIKGKTGAACIDAGIALENYLGTIIKGTFDTVILVDAMHMNKKPGDYEIVQKDDIMRYGFTTHDMSPHLFIETLSKETGAHIYLLGIQPKNVQFGEPMSDPVIKTVNDIIELIQDAKTQINK